MCLATSKTIPFDAAITPRFEQMQKIFFPIVKRGKLQEFKKNWARWLVLTNRLEDEKCPGLLKEEFSTRDGEIVALSPKNYQVYCRTKGKLYFVYSILICVFRRH